MSFSVRTYEANNAYGSIDEFYVDPTTETVMDLLRKLRASPKLYNKHARVGMRLRTYHDHEPGGALINDVEKDPSVLTKTLSELQRAGVLQYEHGGTRLLVLVDGCRDEREAVEYALEPTWCTETLGVGSLRRGVDDRTVLHAAAEKGRAETVRALVREFKSDAEAADRNGSRPLHFAAWNGHTETVRVLVNELKSDVKAVRNSKSTPLHLAAQNGHTKTVRALVAELKSDIMALNDDGYTPLHLAAQNGHTETVHALVAELGSEVRVVNKYGSTPLHLAACSGHAKTVRALVAELGGNIKAVDNNGFTAPRGRVMLILCVSSRLSWERIRWSKIFTDELLTTFGVILYPGLCDSRLPRAPSTLGAVLPQPRTQIPLNSHSGSGAPTRGLILRGRSQRAACDVC